MIITLDGQSGTGKSTLANALAQKLDFKYLNSGMIYRAYAYYFLLNNAIPTDISKIKKILKNTKVIIKFEQNKQYVIINNIDCTPYISSKEVQNTVSLFSTILQVRNRCIQIEREFAKKNDIVIEGRDIGTVVFPNADVKFFVTCDISIRAQRRLLDLKKLGQDITLQQVQESLEKRDYLDSTRKYSPLLRAKDAIDIDTSDKTIDETLNIMLEYINKRS